jgi:hypothetical protein
MRNSKKEKNWSDGKTTEHLDMLKKNKETARGVFWMSVDQRECRGGFK